MACEILKQKIYDKLKGGYFCDKNDLVDVSDGFDGLIHVVIISRKFDGKLVKERHNLIWDELVKHLSNEEWGHVSLSVGASPEDVKTFL